MSGSLPRRVRTILIAGAVAVACAIPFLASLRGGFVAWDDEGFVLRNPLLRDLSPRGLLSLLLAVDPNGSFYQPLANLSMAFQYRLWGPSPLGFHAFDLALHALNCALLFAIARRLLAWGRAGVSRSDEAGAALAALLFGVHPLRVESVAWVSEWRDVQAAAFFLAAVYAHLRMAAAPAALRPRWRAAVCLLAACCVLTKLTGIMLPLALVLLDVYPLRRSNEPIWREKWPLFAIAGAQAAFGWMIARLAEAVVGLSWRGRLAQAFYGLGFYVSKTVVPIGLSPLYERSWLLAPEPFVFYGLVGTALLAVCFAARRRLPALAAAGAYYVLALLPVLLIRSGRQIAADRFSYLSCVGWALLLGAGASRLWARRGMRVPISAAAAAVLLLLGSLTWRQCLVWGDSVSLWRRVVAVEPDNYFGRYKLARVLRDAGDAEEATIERNIAYNTEVQAYRRGAILLMRRGDLAGAAACWGKLRELELRKDDYSL